MGRGNPVFLLGYLPDCFSEWLYLDCHAALAMTKTSTEACPTAVCLCRAPRPTLAPRSPTIIYLLVSKLAISSCVPKIPSGPADNRMNVSGLCGAHTVTAGL